MSTMSTSTTSTTSIPYISTHYSRKTPNGWFINCAFSSPVKVITPTHVAKIHAKGYEKIYLSAGSNPARKQMSELDDMDFSPMADIKFKVVMIDSLNPYHYSTIKRLFPSDIYICGKSESFDTGLSNSWNSSNSVNPGTLKKDDPIYQYYLEWEIELEVNHHTDFQTYVQNCWNRVLDQPLELTYEEKRLQQQEKDEAESPFGGLIRIIRKYSVINWTCINAPENHPIPEEKFQEQYHFLPQTVIRQCPIIYYFQGKKFEGGSIVRPLGPVTRYEFENFFSFGLGCGNFNPQKTRYYYSGTMSMDRQNDNSIFSFLEQFGDIPKDPEFYRFLVWAAINYMGVLNSNQEDKMAEELARELDMEPMSKKEVECLMFPIPK